MTTDLASMFRRLLSRPAVFLAPLTGRTAWWPASDSGLSWALGWKLGWKLADVSRAGLPPAQRLPGVDVNRFDRLAGIDWRRPARIKPQRRLALARDLG